MSVRSIGAVSLVIALVPLSCLGLGYEMGVFRPIVLFSEVNGSVSRNGTPVEGAEVVQTVRWSDDAKDNPEYRTVTDRNGAFHFAKIERRAWFRRVLPAQPVMQQSILIRHGGIEYTAWRHGKLSFDADTELDGRPFILLCELTRPPGYEGNHYGICQAK